MRFGVVVYGAPASSQGAAQALGFCEALIKSQHELALVFFYHDGVYNASTLPVASAATDDLLSRWQLLRDASPDSRLLVCVGAASRRGILSAVEAKKYGKAPALGESFELAGLGELAAATIDCDRLVTFAE